MTLQLEAEDINNQEGTLGLVAQISGIDTFILLYTGASHYFISKEFLTKLEIKPTKIQGIKLKTAIGFSLIENEAGIKLQLGGSEIFFVFKVVKDLCYSIILGKNFYTETNAKLNFEDSTITINDKVHAMVNPRNLLYSLNEYTLSSGTSKEILGYTETTGRVENL